MKTRGTFPHMIAAIAMASCFVAAGEASAAVWQYGCTGSLGAERIAFNRERLVIIEGKGQTGKADDFIRFDKFVPGSDGVSKSVSIAETYLSADGNSGLAKSLTYKGDNDTKIVLTEQSSRKINKASRLLYSCRDETFDRTRKVYRLERPGQPPRTVTLVCLEYELSTKGGRTCR